MESKKVTDKAFRKYGQVLEGYDFSEMIEVMKNTPWTAEGEGFKSIVILPRGTNEPLETVPEKTGEDALLMAKNKWLLAHPDAEMEGAHIGLKGENLKK